ncbi:MAG: DUF4389 domain-containing protein [Methylococcales bacterium]|nr:DUF4389 domain-containing protein [Methylococcales bacterium]MDP3839507.1 DUF4389 domain-containing protein [Methylococcales bacterium]
MKESVSYNLAEFDIWKRFFFMLVFAAIASLVRLLIWAVTAFQVVFALLTGRANQHILSFGRSLSVYTYHIMLYLTFCTETLPFPFTAWNISADLQLPDE